MHLKKLIVIRWKKIIVLCLLIVLIGGIACIKGFDLGSTVQTNSNRYDPPEGTLEWLYKDALKTILLPYVQEAVSDYYEENTGYSPIVDIWGNTVIKSIESPKAFTYIVKFEVSPYLGAHNSIGIDQITLKVSISGEITVEKFEHIKSYPIPPWLQPIE